MGIYKQNGKWIVDYNYRGQRIRKAVSNKKSDAVAYLARIQNDIQYKRHPFPKNEKVIFVEFAKQYVKLHARHKKSFTTDKSLLKALVQYFGTYTLADVAIDAKGLVALYKMERLKRGSIRGGKLKKDIPISKTTINRELALLRHMLTMAVEWDYIAINPLKGLKLMFPEKPKENIIAVEELQRLIALAREPLKAQIIVALNTGMRKNEILKLKWDSVNLREGFIKTRSKTAKIRIIPLNDELFDLLSRLSLNRDGREYVFMNPKTGKPYVNNRGPWKTLLKRAKIDEFRFHDLRHCFATYALLNGGDLISLQETLGHTDVRTTRRYAKAMLEGQRRLVNGFQIGDNYGKIEPMPERKRKSS